MKVVKIVIISMVTLIAVIAAVFFLLGYFREKPAGVFIDTSPLSGVYINGNFAGKTPYTISFKAGEITLKLVPESTDVNLVVFETKITLIAGIQTVIRREFGDSEDASSGDIISFDKIGSQEVGLIVISTPENAQISIDGSPQGFAPYNASDISPAQHQITVAAPGYTSRVMTVKTEIGYRLNVFAKLSKAVSQTPVSTPPPVAITYIQILSTPTGFLRVRTAPGTAGEEIAEVKTGDKFPFLDEDVATGWMEIQYEAPAPGLPNGITGWVSGQYVKKLVSVEDSTTSATLK
jgi:hypothetical protein